MIDYSKTARKGTNKLRSYMEKFPDRNVSIGFLHSIFGNADDVLLYQLIEPLLQCGALTPIGPASRNLGNGRHLHDRYATSQIKTVPKLATSGRATAIATCGPSRYERSILRHLDERLTRNGFLESHLVLFREWRREIAELSSWLKSHDTSNMELVSARERSSEIWGDDKILERKERRPLFGGTTFAELLARCGVHVSTFASYSAKSIPQYHLAHATRQHINVVICENQCTWLSMRHLMQFEGQRSFFGTQVDGALYGEGSNTAGRKQLAAFMKELPESTSVTFLYWGDIDRPGMDVLAQTCAMRPIEDRTAVRPFAGAYRAMLDLAYRKHLPAAGNTPLQARGAELSGHLNKRQRRLLRRVLDQNLRLPQEIVTRTVMRSTEEALEPGLALQARARERQTDQTARHPPPS